MAIGLARGQYSLSVDIPLFCELRNVYILENRGW